MPRLSDESRVAARLIALAWLDAPTLGPRRQLRDVFAFAWEFLGSECFEVALGLWIMSQYVLCLVWF